MILNKTQLTEIQQLLEDNFSTLIELFLQDSKKHIKTITQWETTAQNSSVMMAAHTLKSSAANLGLDKLASQCSLIEAACDQNQDQDIPELIANLNHLYADSLSALKSATT